MGYKIGSDDRLISNLHILGVKALIISVFAIVFSIIFVKLFYWRIKKMIIVSCAVIVGILLGYFTKSYINFDISLLIQFGLISIIIFIEIV